MGKRGNTKLNDKEFLDDETNDRDVLSALVEERSCGVFEMDSIDWASVARAYKILRMYPNVQDINENLRTDYYHWLTLCEDRIEFEIALRMRAEELIENGQCADPLSQDMSQIV